MEICPYCGTRNPLSNVAEGQPPRCHECGGIIDELSQMATQIAMGPWYFRMPGKPYGPGCDISVLRKLLGAKRIKADSPVRGPATHQLWRRARHIAGISHLAGVCHVCGESVKPDSKFCSGCGEKFNVPEGRNEWGLPAEAPETVIAGFRAKDPRLCPVCGFDGVDGDDCPECGTIFAPAAEATPVTLGGWFVRTKAHDYKPGVSVEQLKREIAAGLINSRTVVRGPTTEQFWVPARNAPGLANLTGHCHACGEKVEPGDSQCTACGAMFVLPADANWIGLRYPTAEAVSAAQKKLDAELAKIAAIVAATPLPKPRQPREEQVADVAQVVEAEYDDEPVEQDYVQPEEYHATGHSAFEDTVTSSTDDAGGFAIDDAPAVSLKDRRKVEQLRKSQSTLITLLVLTPIVIIGAFFAINAMSGGGDNKDAVVKDGKNAPKDNKNQFKAQASETVLKAKSDAEALWATVKDTPRKGKAQALLAQAELALMKANDSFEAQNFFDAETQYQKIAEPVKALKDLQSARDAAIGSRSRANSALESAKQLDAPGQAPEFWDKANASFELGLQAFETEEFDQARVQWDIAVEHYGQASKLVQTMRNAADMRAAVEKEATAKYERAVLDAANIPAWQALVGKLTAGETAANEKNYVEALKLFEQARLMIPSVEFAMQLEIGRNYYAYQCGRLTARIMKGKGSNYHPDEELLAQLKRSYENLGINRDFFNRVPKAKSTSAKEMGNVMIVDCGKEIESSFENGGEVSKAFALGIHMVIVDSLLRVDVGKLTTATRQDLELYLKKVMPDDAKAAGWSPDFVAFLQDADSTLAIEENIPAKTREKWAAMTEKLDNFDEAMKIMAPKK